MGEGFVQGELFYAFFVLDVMTDAPQVIENEAVGKVKREVARYAQRSAHEREGLLVMDGAEVDEMVAVLTVCAMAEGKEHFLH